MVGTTPRSDWVKRLLVLVLLLVAGQARAETNDKAPPLRVGLYVSEPFVMTGPHGYTGLAVDLWNALAVKLGRSTEFVRVASLGDLLKETQEGQLDVAVTNVIVTADRAQRLSFTQPWFDAGLRIMVREEPQVGFWELVGDLRKFGYLKSYAWLGTALVAVTLLLTLVERRIDADFPRRWGPGLAQSFYHVMSVTTSGRTTHKNVFGSIGTLFAASWMVCSVGVMAYVTSTVTSVMTSSSIVRHISGLGDLPGKRVGVEEGSIAEEYALRLGLDTRSYHGVAEGVAALMADDLDAFLGDTANLEYFNKQHPKLPLTMVGKIFETSKYAFALPPNSPLTHSITVELLSLEEVETVAKLRVHYFGANS